MAKNVQRRLAAILAADVVGYSRLIVEDEAGTLEALRAHREKLIEPKIAEHEGRVVKLMGDGLLAEFPSAVEAVQCAIEIQHTMVERNADVPEERRITYRIGINIGDIFVEGDDIYGDGVNIAARLEGLADPGGICISRSVHTQIADKLDLEFEDLGEQQVKNIAKPVMVYRVALDEKAAALVTPVTVTPPTTGRGRWPQIAAGLVLGLVGVAGLVWWQPWAPDVEPASVERMAFPLPDKPSIAVLPFDNLSGNPEQDWLGDGLTENIIAVLSTSPNLFVIARNSTFTYKGKAVKVQQVAEELGVRHVLEGSVQRTGDKLRITAKLVDALTGRHLWAERYDRNLEDLFALQDEITHAIITALQVKLTQGEQVRIGSGRATNFEAWELEQRSLHLFQRFTRENNTRARQLAESSVDLDPNYALAWVRLAWTHALDVRYAWVEDRVGALSSATEAAQKALALDETLPDAHAALGFIHTLKREHEEAVADMRNAVALDPNHATAMALLAVSLTFSGSPEEAITLIKKAMRLSPYYPAWYPAALGRAYRVTGQFVEAIAAIKKSIERNPDELGPHVELTAAYSEADRSVEARTAAGEVLRIDPKFTLSRWAKTLAYRDSGEQEQYLAALRKAGLPE